MADLNNLLGELEEQEERLLHEDDDDATELAKGTTTGRPSLDATEATEPMTYDDEWETPTRSAVPSVLQQVKNHRVHSDDYDIDKHVDSVADEPDPYIEGLSEALQGTTAHEDDLYQQLHQQWQQELYSPEILPYDAHLVDSMVARMEERQDWIDQLQGSAADNAAIPLMTTLAQLDLDRARFVLSNWLAARLTKIERHPLYMRDKIDCLSDQECEYLKEFGMLLEDHLRRTVLDHIPEAWQSLDEPHMIDTPNRETYHFWAIQDFVELEGGDGGMETLEKGGTVIQTFEKMEEYMAKGKVRLLF
eukprot:Nitzschia sp. Nitz4//scaffold207_size38617//13416//14330//NITZ4_007676-RA/size38617-processed-gene-0.39-mRNA-1//-1//CDS//3329541608//4720//frame0